MSFLPSVHYLLKCLYNFHNVITIKINKKFSIFSNSIIESWFFYLSVGARKVTFAVEREKNFLTNATKISTQWGDFL